MLRTRTGVTPEALAAVYRRCPHWLAVRPHPQLAKLLAELEGMSLPPKTLSAMLRAAPYALAAPDALTSLQQLKGVLAARGVPRIALPDLFASQPDVSSRVKGVARLLPACLPWALPAPPTATSPPHLPPAPRPPLTHPCAQIVTLHPELLALKMDYVTMHTGLRAEQWGRLSAVTDAGLCSTLGPRISFALERGYTFVPRCAAVWAACLPARGGARPYRPTPPPPPPFLHPPAPLPAPAARASRRRCPCARGGRRRRRWPPRSRWRCGG